MLQQLSKLDWLMWSEKIGIIAIKAIGLYIAYILVSKVLHKVIHHSFEKLSARDEISTARAKTLQALVENIVSYGLFFVFAVTLLQLFNIQATAILAGAGVVGLAIGFGAQGLVSDVVTGFFILLEKQMDVGDYVTTGLFTGVVEGIGLRTTRIRSLEGTLHFIPNRQILAVSNHSRGTMNALVDVAIPTGEKIDEMLALIHDVCDSFKGREEIIEGPTAVGVQNMTTNEYTIRIIAKTAPLQHWDIERALRLAIKQAQDAIVIVEEEKA